MASDEQRVLDLLRAVAREVRPRNHRPRRVPRRAVRPGARLGPLLRGQRWSRARPRSAEARSSCASPRPARPDRYRATRSATAWARRRSSPTVPTRSGIATSDRCSPARRSGASSSASQAPDRTSPACRPERCAMVTSGSSTGRRSGPRSRTSRRFGMLIARTDPEATKARGLTYFVVDMHAPWRRGAPVAPDHRRGRVQRGVLHRRAHPRRRTARRRRRRLAGFAHDAHERAGVDRRAASRQGSGLIGAP